MKNPLLIVVFVLIGIANADFLAITRCYAMEEVLVLGKWTQKTIDTLLSEASTITDIGEKIDFLSSKLLNTSYVNPTLIGDKDTKERLVINLNEMDCFTFIDYIEAMRISKSYVEFKKNLISLRYKDDTVEFLKRNHFFTDWALFNKEHVHDITKDIGQDNIKTVQKTLNVKANGSLYLQGFPITNRHITYIPAKSVTKEMTDKLQTGDYMGVYSPEKGLDVSHVGIIIRKNEKIYFRNASSLKKNMQVVDSEFFKYISTIPGIVVLRPI
ncbi:MAG: DUF1460 domain-containing protein [Candidatus Magnetoovum sp. WYHC-5]|nr:DUF1460 domain-containing protein [Candidatus Magnetoovum sp. WYHC-5]